MHGAFFYKSHTFTQLTMGEVVYFKYLIRVKYLNTLDYYNA
jgi:hypothetical protein